MSNQSRNRRTIAILGAASTIFALGSALPNGAEATANNVEAAYASASPGDKVAPSAQQMQQIQQDVTTLPQELKAAIQRDLGISAQEYLTRATRAQNAVVAVDAIQARTNGVTASYAKDGKITVAVTSDRAASQARAIGLDAKLVAFSAADLDRHTLEAINTLKAKGLLDTLMSAAPEAGDSIKVTVTNGHVAQAQAALKGGPVAINVVEGGDKRETTNLASETIPPNTDFAVDAGRGLNGTTMRATDPSQVSGSLSLCSIGFNATNAAGEDSVITAGHCVGSGRVTNWFLEDEAEGVRSKVVEQGAGPVAYLGNVAQWRFGQESFEGSPGTALLPQDYAYLDIANSHARLQPRVYTWPNQSGNNPQRSISVRSTGSGIAGEAMCRSGRTSGWQCGTITSTNAVSSIGDKAGNASLVRGVQARVCSLPGDSGGSALMGTMALGVLSGGSSEPDNDSRTSAQCLVDSRGLPGSSTFSGIDAITADRDGYFVKLELQAPQASVVDNAGKFQVSGSAVPGDTVHLFVDGTSQSSGLVATDGTFSLDLATSTGAARNITVFTQRDAVNKSEALNFAITADGTVSQKANSAAPGTDTSTVPTDPTDPTDPVEPTPAAGAPVILSPAQGATISGDVVITGTAAVNSTVQYQLQSDQGASASGSLSMNSNDRFELSGSLPAGSWTLQVHSTSPEGVRSGVTTRNFTVLGSTMDARNSSAMTLQEHAIGS